MPRVETAKEEAEEPIDQNHVEAGGNDMEEDEPHTEEDAIYIDSDTWSSALDKQMRQQVKESDCEVLQLVRELGGAQRQYKKERQKQLRAVVSEIYSPPLVTAMAKLLPSLGLLPGFAMDLATTDAEGNYWDFDKPEQRHKA